MTNYLCISNIPKALIDDKDISDFLSLTKNDPRVSCIKKNETTNMFYAEIDELEKGEYSLGSLANHLHELPSERRSRLSVERAELPDIINITNFMSYGDRNESDVRSLPKYTNSCLQSYIEQLDPSTIKAQCLNISGYKLFGNESIADRFLRDHVNKYHALRSARHAVNAGCANEINRIKNNFGDIVFEDGSIL